MKLVSTAYAEAPALARTRFADYLELTKPRISVLVLFTLAAGVLLASAGRPDWVLLLHAVVGTGLVAAGASALNQFLERESDALMERTENRPLPAGRLLAAEVLGIGIGLAGSGILYLALTLRHPLAAVIAALTFVSYVFVYTPLKRRSSLNTLVGAIPGALPPVIGWAAVRGSLDPEIGAVFVILYLWQVPHFLAIAWMYRDDYERAGLCMLPVMDPTGEMTGRQMVSYCLALVPASLAPLVLGSAGLLYVWGALVLGAVFLGCSIGFARERSAGRARGVMRASLVYLPAILAMLLVDAAWR